MRGVLRMLVAAMALAGAALPSGAGSVSKAVELLFQTPYLENLPANTTLVYTIEQNNRKPEMFGEPLSDEIRLRLEPGGDGRTTAYLDVYSGARQRQIGPMPGVSGNPAVMIVLEMDTVVLNRALGGMPAYFRNRIRAALRDGATVEPVKISLDGREIAASKITIRPFENDANMGGTREFTGQTYEFVVADQVPGGIYRVSSILPADAPATGNLREQNLTFNRVQPN